MIVARCNSVNEAIIEANDRPKSSTRQLGVWCNDMSWDGPEQICLESLSLTQERCIKPCCQRGGSVATSHAGRPTYDL